jgi:uncharacterized protein
MHAGSLRIAGRRPRVLYRVIQRIAPVFARYTPNAESLRRSRWLCWLGPRAREPQAWNFNRRSVARGVAIGAFSAVLVPFGQILLAVLGALMLRASPLAAAMTTFISNPLTIGPIYFGAYQLGALLLRLAGLRDAIPAAPVAPPGEWLVTGWSMFLSHGAPLLLGVPLLAAAAAAIGYALTQFVWRRRVMARRAARKSARRLASTVAVVEPCVPFGGPTDEACTP